ncbi:DNA polymerase beta domain protein region [Ferroglobus placidus DSM 10642]|uniref:DNA polymerase beta domain protein region n=1 Tax=Ferroglobus placidus (strain DSM 10642 / AEDII12DO) TaxID=589924 RepID=D3S251_FERPA|nr:nucleotidyltransferase domain-containing protein [Ferroglobus placidus]ADC66542.1 DNA polymerase beta domain protein region [Ferroglobus placidus DSM 10642]
MQRNLPKRVIEVAEKLKEALYKRGIKISGIYLFGSYARGDYLKRSDIDLIVVSDDWEGVAFLKRLDIVNEIIWKEKLGNVEVIPVTTEELKRKESIVLRDARKYWIRVL